MDATGVLVGIPDGNSVVPGSVYYPGLTVDSPEYGLYPSFCPLLVHFVFFILCSILSSIFFILIMYIFGYKTETMTRDLSPYFCTINGYNLHSRYLVLSFLFFPTIDLFIALPCLLIHFKIYLKS